MRKSKRVLKWSVFIGLAVILLISIMSCQGPPDETGPAETVAAATCSDCHNDTTLISAKSAQIALTTHVTGEGWHYAGSRAACTACHSSEGFITMVAAGTGVGDGEDRPDASPPNCRTCHQIHTTYTEADWALRTTDPVTLVASGETFDSGKGNLCATCHQPRREIAVEDGIVDVSSTHWGPHHGPQSTMLLGIGGWGADGNPAAHYSMVEDGCPTCHLPDDNHLLSPSLNREAIKSCQSCHADAENFDIGGTQTEVDALIAELEELLIAKGLLAGEHGDTHPVVGEYPEAEAGALWNYILIAVEDGSHGVHNPAYTKALLEASIEALQ